MSAITHQIKEALKVIEPKGAKLAQINPKSAQNLVNVRPHPEYGG
jgi:hypothetical protein